MKKRKTITIPNRKFKILHPWQVRIDIRHATTIEVCQGNIRSPFRPLTLNGLCQGEEGWRALG